MDIFMPGVGFVGEAGEVEGVLIRWVAGLSVFD